MAIQFSCHCGNIFQLDESEAGAEIQCTRCGRLNDIPLPSDLKSITHDGTFELDEAPVLHDPKKAAELIYVYSRHEHDEDGYEKDLRLTEEEAQHIGTGAPAHIAGQKQMPHAPRYDPETGELVREIELAPREARVLAPHEIPMAAASLSYATARVSSSISITNAFVHLVQPGNLAVMGALFVMHAFSWPLLGVLLNGMIFLGFAIPFFVIGMIGHYGNIVDEIGPCDHDELPRPMRDLHFYDDMWLPFTNVFSSLLICYWPVLAIGFLAGKVDHRALLLISAILVGVGSFVFPAVFLTLQTSGTPANLRPDRVLNVIKITGPRYFVLTALWIASFVSYSWGIFGPGVAMYYMMASYSTPHIFWWRLTVPMLIVGIFLTHYFCYGLGLLYRAHHADFPWILQRHVRTAPPPVVAAPKTPRRRV